MYKYKVFVSCHFPPGPLAELCRSIGNAIDLDMVVADRPSVDDLVEKVKRVIYSCDATLLLWENRLDEKSNDWLTVEYAISRAMNKPIAIIRVGASPLPSSFKIDSEWLKLDGYDQLAQVVKIAEYLNVLKNKLQQLHTSERQIHNPNFIREFVKHQVTMTGDGRARYETHVHLKSLTYGLSVMKHSIHINQSILSTDKTPLSFELLPLDDKRKYSKKISATAPDKITFTVDIDPPLNKNDVGTYGWRTDFFQFLPQKRDELVLLQQGLYAFPNGRAQHHWFINHPTELLAIEIEFQDAMMVGECEPKAYNGRVYSDLSLDYEETERIQKFFSTEEFMGRKLVSLKVEKPSFGFNYAILYEMKNIFDGK